MEVKGEANMETMLLDARTLREKIAASGILKKQFAEMAGVNAPYLSNILYGRENPTPSTWARIGAALEELERNPPERERRPRGRHSKRAEQLRAEQLASGCEQAVRYL